MFFSQVKIRIKNTINFSDCQWDKIFPLQVLCKPIWGLSQETPLNLILKDSSPLVTSWITRLSFHLICGVEMILAAKKKAIQRDSAVRTRGGLVDYSWVRIGRRKHVESHDFAYIYVWGNYNYAFARVRSVKVILGLRSLEIMKHRNGRLRILIELDVTLDVFIGKWEILNEDKVLSLSM